MREPIRFPFATALFVLLVLTTGAPASAEAAFRVDVDARADALTVVAAEGEATLALPGFHELRQTGQPAVPARAFSFAVEDGRTVDDARLEGGRWVRVPVATAPTPLAPLEPFEAEGIATERPFVDGVLGRSASFPPVEARLVADRTWHGQRIVTVEAYPVRVDADGSVWVREGAELVVTLGAGRGVERVQRVRGVGDWRTRVETLLRGAVENPTDVRVGTAAAKTSLDGPQASAAAGPSLDSAPVQHLIVTTTALAPAFQRLADHRMRLGMPSLVVTLDEILAVTRQGVDTAETIRNYLQDAYALWGVDYVVLGGDTELIPTRYCRNTFYPSGSFTDIPTDLYYGGLDGNWNDDGDGLFGEHYISSANRGDFVDFDAEIAVGRATVATPAAAEAFVDKVIAYEIPVDTTWQRRALFASEVLFPLGWSEGDPQQLHGAFLSETVIDSAFVGCQDVPWEVERQYEVPEAYPGATPISPANVVDALDTGTFGIFHHVGHGFFFTMSVGPGALVPADADGLTNGPNYFLLYSLNCSSSAFDFNCLNERFVNNPNGGAMASLGSSRAAFPSAAGPLQEEFYEAWLCDGTDRLGDVYSASRAPFLVTTLYNTVQRWTQMVYALIGDPAMMLYRDTPENVMVGAAPQVTLGGNPSNVVVLDGQGLPVPGVTVSATKAGEDRFVGVTDLNGTVQLAIQAETPGSIEVWASGGQVVPASATIQVVAGSIAVGGVASFAIDDDATAPSDGNGNGRVEAGERIALVPTIRNGGTETHPGGNVALSVPDSFVTVVTSARTFGSVAGGASVTTDAFVFDVDPAAPDGHRIELSFAVDNGLGVPQVDVETIQVGAPRLEVVALDYLDGNDGSPGALETADVVLTLKNYGSGAAGAATGTLSVVSGSATVLDDVATWSTGADVVLGTADNAGDPFQVRFDGDPSLVQLEATITDAAGRVFVHTFDAEAPGVVPGLALASAGSGRIQIEWSRPNVADLLGYRVYRRAEGEVDFTLATPDVLLGSATYFDGGLAPLTTFTYAVSAVDASGNEGPLSFELSASTNPPEIDCFPLPLGLETSGALAISHVDDDGVLDMVIGADSVYLIDGECREPLDGDNDAQTFGPIFEGGKRFGPASITLAELDPNRRGLEIVAMERDKKELFVMDQLGNVLPGFPKKLTNWAWGSPVVGDLDGDGTALVPDNEIVINDLSGYTYAFHHDGTEVADGDGDPTTDGPIAPRRQQTIEGVVYDENFGRTTPALYDLDGNGTLEIIFGSKFQNVAAPEFFYALRVDQPGTNAPGWPKQFAPRSEFLASPTLADIDGDGSIEIITPCQNEQLYVWETDGSDQPGFPVTLFNNAVNFDSLTPSPAVGNFDGDPELEIVVVGITRDTIDGSLVYQSRLEIRDTDGTLLPGWPVIIDDLSESSPVVGDVDGDGVLDVVFGIGGTEADDALFAFTADGQPVRGFPIPINGFVRATPSLVDFDRNGTLDIALATWDRLIHVWDTGAPYDPAMAPWPTFRGNVNRTGVFGTVVATSAPSDDVPAIAGRAALAEATPNPFNPQTRISFALAGAADDVRLDVFDVQGRHVRSLARGAYDTGSYDVVWSGVDTQGRRVASGVYYAVLEVDGERIASRKMALVK